MFLQKITRWLCVPVQKNNFRFSQSESNSIYISEKESSERVLQFYYQLFVENIKGYSSEYLKNLIFVRFKIKPQNTLELLGTKLTKIGEHIWDTQEKLTMVVHLIKKNTLQWESIYFVTSLEKNVNIRWSI